MSHRSQIAYLSIAKIKIIYGNNIFISCVLGPPGTSVPTIEKKYSIEILDFTVVSLGSSWAPTPTDEIKIVCSINRRTRGGEHTKPSLVREGGPLAVDEVFVT